MEMKDTTYALSRTEWHRWLEQHHATATEIWLVYYKRDTGRPSVSYSESLEEALCFGWIDSLIQKIDDEKYARKFTPRRAGSKWSALNKHLVVKLVAQGRMTPAGLACVDFPLAEASAARPLRPPLALPDWLAVALALHPLAWQNFNAMPPSHCRQYIAWISDAKKEETRQRRILAAVARLEKNAPLGMV
jgi:uncharacterized protein YdeI (YjbR/CyaY-like superfamily)